MLRRGTSLGLLCRFLLLLGQADRGGRETPFFVWGGEMGYWGGSLIEELEVVVELRQFEW